ANLVEGDYEARIFLLRDMRVIDVFSDTIEVRRAGIGRIIYWGAREYPALYGVLSIVVALIAGWLASAFFRTFFPN
ncbi:MAG: TIGR02186 family protein, partial [Pseudomonadota bacterium]